MRTIPSLALIQFLLAGGALAQVETTDFPPCAQPAGEAAALEVGTDVGKTPPRVLALTSLEPRLAALLARGVEGGSVTMAVAAAPLPASALGTEAALAVVEIAGASLLDSHPGGCLGVEIALLAVDGNGRVVASRHDGVAIDAPAGAAFDATGLRYLARLELPPGPVSLRALVRVHRTGAFALGTTRITLPAAAAPAAAPPAGEEWLQALAPGAEITAVAALVAAGTLPHPLVGTAVAATAAASAAAGVPPPPPAEELEDLSTLVDGHLAALRTLGAGQPREALARLESLDVAALEADPGDGLDRIARARERVLQKFGTNQRRALLPVALLYSELRRSHLAGRRAGLAQIADEAARRVLERFATAPAPREERPLAAAVMDGLAAEDLRHGDPSRAILLLAHAVDLEPDRVGRWLALALLYERDWRLADAARAVERVLELEPGHREALLRSARVARERGEAERAAALLEPLLAAPERDWIHAVAVEERARIHFDAGRFDLAVPLLEAASDLLPEEAPLAAALAFAHFRNANRSGAFAAAVRAAAAGKAGRVAPRRRYGDLPLTYLLQSRTTAEAEGLLRLDALARAVAKIESER